MGTMKQTYTYEIFADYFQFYLQDQPVQGNLGDSWTEEAVESLLAIAPGRSALAPCATWMSPWSSK
jgi:hypothetical protein